MVRPLCMTSMETPRLLSEYFAARAQSAACISADAEVDVVIRRERAINHRPRLISGERRLPACTIRSLAEYISQRKHWKRCKAVRGKLPRTTGRRPVLPRSETRTLARICCFRRGGCRRFGRCPLRDRQMTRAQLFYIRQFVQSAQAEVIKKKLRGLVQKRAPGNFGASGDFNQAAFHYCLQHAIDIDTAHCFNIGTRNRLAIRNNRERFERGCAQARRFGRGKKL